MMQLADIELDDAQAPANFQQDGARAPLSVRLRLMRKLADLVVLPVGQLTRNELSFTADILIQVLENVDVQARGYVAMRISGFAEIPSQLQRYLVLQDAQVAGPVLAKASSISEPLLIEAARKSPEHRNLIVQREDMTSAILDELVSFAEPNIIRQVLKQQDVVISDVTMDILVQRSEAEEEFRGLLLARLELRVQHGLSMFWWLDPRQRRTALLRFSTDRSIIQDAMHELFVEVFTSENPDILVRDILKLIERRYRPRGRDGEMVTMEVVEKTLHAARQVPGDEINHAVGLLAGVSQETAARILADVHGEPFAVLCKSIGLSRNSFHNLYEPNTAGEPIEGIEFAKERRERLMVTFDSIARDYSRMILRYWDWHSCFQAKEDLTLLAQQGTTDESYLGAV